MSGNTIPFQPFPKIPRLKGTDGCVITEKLDGTNASIYIDSDGNFLCGSRTRWLTAEHDNYGFFKWCQEHKEDLLKLGVGHHFGEWWGLGIQRGYDLKEKKFSLFNVARWSQPELRPSCCDVVPVLSYCEFNKILIDEALQELSQTGSKAAPGYMKPEGIIIYVPYSDTLYKKTFEGDKHKGELP